MSWRAPDREDRQVVVLWALCVVAALGLRPLWLAMVPFAPPCPWHAMTGWPCPGCGSTRAMVLLLHLDLPGALAMNPLATCAAAFFVAGGLAAPAWLALGGQRPLLPSRPKPALLALLVGAVLANWAWLVATGV